MKKLLFLVIFMGILIVAGTAFLIFSIVTGLHKKIQFSSGDTISPHKVLKQPTPRYEEFLGDHTLSLPDNQTVLDFDLAGNRLILHLQDTVTHSQQWYIVDITTGKKLGSLSTAPIQ